MAAREVHLELLLSHRVVDSMGRNVGRIEELRAKRDGGDVVVAEYLLGSDALLERFLGFFLELPFLRLFRGKKKGFRVPWHEMDLSDPKHPRLRCTQDELRPIEDDQ
jgi:sporulation protein YlmC with PRC-barrel domain